MQLDDFMQIANYANENWKANLTEREITENAVMLFEDYQCSIENDTVSKSIKTLLENLDEDNCEESLNYANMIRQGLGLLTVEK